jgi:hypothetical protein
MWILFQNNVSAVGDKPFFGGATPNLAGLPEP